MSETSIAVKNFNPLPRKEGDRNMRNSVFANGYFNPLTRIE